MQTTVKERLIQFIKYEGLTQRAFERSIGAGNGYLTNMRGSIGADKVQRISSEYPKLNIEWLVSGVGSMLNDSACETENLNEEESCVRVIRERYNLTQDELARMIGVSARTVQNWESGGIIPATSRQRLSELFSEANEGNVASNIQGDNTQNSGKLVEALAHTLAEKDKQIAQLLEQSERLLAVIEKMQQK